ncbi:hypothetical protein [Leptolyngbya iicbica]
MPTQDFEKAIGFSVMGSVPFSKLATGNATFCSATSGDNAALLISRNYFTPLLF